jgi:hypothetical protein
VILVLAPEVTSGYGALVLAVSIGIALIITLAYVRTLGADGDKR